MDLILPKKPGLPRRRAAAIFLFAVAAGAVAGAWLVWRRPAPAAAEPTETAADALARTRIDALENEIVAYEDALTHAEEFGDRARYLEAVYAAARKSLDADAEWYRWRDQQSRRPAQALADGMEQAFFEGWQPRRFTEADKFAMLAETHGLPVESVRFLKAEIEVMFADEFAEKFAPAGETAPTETDS